MEKRRGHKALSTGTRIKQLAKVTGKYTWSAGLTDGVTSKDVAALGDEIPKPSNS